jgi:hypothetical protein
MTTQPSTSSAPGGSGTPDGDAQRTQPPPRISDLVEPYALGGVNHEIPLGNRRNLVHAEARLGGLPRLVGPQAGSHASPDAVAPPGTITGAAQHLTERAAAILGHGPAPRRGLTTIHRSQAPFIPPLRVQQAAAPTGRVVQLALPEAPGLDRTVAPARPVLTRPVLTRTVAYRQLPLLRAFAVSGAVPDVQVTAPLPASIQPLMDQRIRQVLEAMPEQRRDEPLLRRLAALAALCSVRPDALGQSVATLLSARAEVSRFVIDQVCSAGPSAAEPAPSPTPAGRLPLPQSAVQLFAGLAGAVDAVNGSGLPRAQQDQLLAVLRDVVTVEAATSALRPLGRPHAAGGPRGVTRVARHLAQLWDGARRSDPGIPGAELAGRLRHGLTRWLADPRRWLREALDRAGAALDRAVGRVGETFRTLLAGADRGSGRGRARPVGEERADSDSSSDGSSDSSSDGSDRNSEFVLSADKVVAVLRAALKARQEAQAERRRSVLSHTIPGRRLLQSLSPDLAFWIAHRLLDANLQQVRHDLRLALESLTEPDPRARTLPPEGAALTLLVDAVSEGMTGIILWSFRGGRLGEQEEQAPPVEELNLHDPRSLIERDLRAIPGLEARPQTAEVLTFVRTLREVYVEGLREFVAEGQASEGSGAAEVRSVARRLLREATEPAADEAWRVFASRVAQFRSVDGQPGLLGNLWEHTARGMREEVDRLLWREVLRNVLFQRNSSGVEAVGVPPERRPGNDAVPADRLGSGWGPDGLSDQVVQDLFSKYSDGSVLPAPTVAAMHAFAAGALSDGETLGFLSQRGEEFLTSGVPTRRRRRVPAWQSGETSSGETRNGSAGEPVEDAGAGPELMWDSVPHRLGAERWAESAAALPFWAAVRFLDAGFELSLHDLAFALSRSRSAAQDTDAGPQTGGSPTGGARAFATEACATEACATEASGTDLSQLDPTVVVPRLLAVYRDGLQQVVDGPSDRVARISAVRSLAAVSGPEADLAWLEVGEQLGRLHAGGTALDVMVRVTRLLAQRRPLFVSLPGSSAVVPSSSDSFRSLAVPFPASRFAASHDTGPPVGGTESTPRSGGGTAGSAAATDLRSSGQGTTGGPSRAVAPGVVVAPGVGAPGVGASVVVDGAVAEFGDVLARQLAAFGTGPAAGPAAGGSAATGPDGVATQLSEQGRRFLAGSGAGSGTIDGAGRVRALDTGVELALNALAGWAGRAAGSWAADPRTASAAPEGPGVVGAQAGRPDPSRVVPALLAVYRQGLDALLQDADGPTLMAVRSSLEAVSGAGADAAWQRVGGRLAELVRGEAPGVDVEREVVEFVSVLGQRRAAAAARREQVVAGKAPAVGPGSGPRVPDGSSGQPGRDHAAASPDAPRSVARRRGTVTIAEAPVPSVPAGTPLVRQIVALWGPAALPASSLSRGSTQDVAAAQRTVSLLQGMFSGTDSRDAAHENLLSLLSGGGWAALDRAGRQPGARGPQTDAGRRSSGPWTPECSRPCTTWRPGPGRPTRRRPSPRPGWWAGAVRRSRSTPAPWPGSCRPSTSTACRLCSVRRVIRRPPRRHCSPGRTPSPTTAAGPRSLRSCPGRGTALRWYRAIAGRWVRGRRSAGARGRLRHRSRGGWAGSGPAGRRSSPCRVRRGSSGGPAGTRFRGSGCGRCTSPRPRARRSGSAWPPQPGTPAWRAPTGSGTTRTGTASPARPGSAGAGA